MSSGEIQQYVLVLKKVEVPYISVPKKDYHLNICLSVHYAVIYDDTMTWIILVLYTEIRICFGGTFHTQI